MWNPQSQSHILQRSERTEQETMLAIPTACLALSLSISLARQEVAKDLAAQYPVWTSAIWQYPPTLLHSRSDRAHKLMHVRVDSV